MPPDFLKPLWISRARGFVVEHFLNGALISVSWLQPWALALFKAFFRGSYPFLSPFLGVLIPFLRHSKPLLGIPPPPLLREGKHAAVSAINTVLFCPFKEGNVLLKKGRKGRLLLQTPVGIPKMGNDRL